jgi:hypothetical protein
VAQTVIQSKYASVKAISPAFAFESDPATLAPRLTARRKRAFCSGTALPDWPLPDKRVLPDDGARHSPWSRPAPQRSAECSIACLHF